MGVCGHASYIPTGGREIKAIAIMYCEDGVCLDMIKARSIEGEEQRSS